MRQSGYGLIGFWFGQKNQNRGTGCGSPARPGLWGGRRVTGTFTRKACLLNLISKYQMIELSGCLTYKRKIQPSDFVPRHIMETKIN